MAFFLNSDWGQVEDYEKHKGMCNFIASSQIAAGKLLRWLDVPWSRDMYDVVLLFLNWTFSGVLFKGSHFARDRIKGCKYWATWIISKVLPSFT